MEINQLEVLVAVARERSFSRAADVLGRTQPAVSQSIKRLEKEMGEVLFDRSSKDGTPTDAGQVLIEYATQILNLCQSAETAVKELRDVKFGKIVLSANEHTVFAVLPIIAEFQRRHPLVKIEVRRGVASRIPEEIASREVELGVLSFKPKDPALNSMAIRTDDLVLVVPPSHRLASHSEVSIRQLNGEKFIAHNARSPYRQHVIEAFARHDTKLEISVELPSLEAIKRLVEAEVGIALVPRLAVAPEIKSKRLVAVDVNELKLTRKLNIVYRKNATLSHAAREFLVVAKSI